MKSRWLAKGTSAVAMIAVMGTAGICPPPARAGVPGLFATEYTQLLNYAELVGQLEKQVVMVENQLTQIADMTKTWPYDYRPTLRDRGLRHRKSATDREHGPGTLVHDEQSGRGFQSTVSRLLVNHQLRSGVSSNGARQASIALSGP